MKAFVVLLMAVCLGAVPARAQISTQQEVALGREAAQKIEAEVGIDPSPELNQRLGRVAQSLVAVCGRNDISYQFKVLNSDQFNAMALPGGFVYATRKLMNTLSDGQLAFVLGHELSHVTQRHSIRQMENDQMRRLGILAVLVGLTGGNVSQESAQLAGVVDQVFSSRYSQADEDEADRLGTQMMARAGIDPAYALLALHTLAAQHDGGMPQFMNTILGSHPLPHERVEAAYGYIPPLAFAPGPANPQPVVPEPDWNRSLSQALQQLGATPNAQLMAGCLRELEGRQFDASGVLLVSPPGETYNQMERRLLTQDLAWIRLNRGGWSQFGLATGQNSAGERLIWLKVR